MSENPKVVVLISADAEWQIIREIISPAEEETSPLGDWFIVNIGDAKSSQPVLFFHGGWGKIAAAASTQYVIDRWSPELILNLGTCGGFEGEIERGVTILVERTVVYDIVEQMGNQDQSIAHYSTEFDLSWLGDNIPQGVLRTLLVSGDRDLIPGEIPHLKERYGAVAGDWESGAIAYVADRNGIRCLILRGVSDLVGSEGGEAYEDMKIFLSGTKKVLGQMVAALPGWLEMAF